MLFFIRCVFMWCLLTVEMVTPDNNATITTVVMTSPVTLSAVTSQVTSPATTSVTSQTSHLTSHIPMTLSTPQATSRGTTTSAPNVTSSTSSVSSSSQVTSLGPHASTVTSSQGTPASIVTSASATSSVTPTHGTTILSSSGAFTPSWTTIVVTSGVSTTAATTGATKLSTPVSSSSATPATTSTSSPVSSSSSSSSSTSSSTASPTTTSTSSPISSSSSSSTSSSSVSPTTTSILTTTSAPSTATVSVGLSTINSPTATVSSPTSGPGGLNSSSVTINSPSADGNNSSWGTIVLPAAACRPRWVVYNGLTSSVTTVQEDGAWVLSVAAVTVADCLDECSRHSLCVAVEVNQTTITSPCGCALVFNTTLYANISRWYPTRRVSTYVIERCPEAGVYTCRAGYSSSAGGVGSTGGKWLQDVSDLDTCQLTCSLDSTCVGIDYDWQSTSCFEQNNRTTFDGRRYTIGPPSLIQYTKVDACVNSCRPSWIKVEDVTSFGTIQSSNTCSLATCIKMCAHNIDCVGIEYNFTESSCSYFPSSSFDEMISSATPALSVVQYRLVDSCQIGCVITWRAEVGARYTLLDPVTLLNATSIDQCGLYCRQSPSCRVYQVTRPASAPIVCTIASDFVLLSRVADVMFTSYLFTEINCTDSSVKSTTHTEIKDSSNTCVGWTTYRDSYVLGGLEVPSVNSVADCQLTCTNSSTCTGVDYNPYNPSGQRCYIISSNPSVIKVGEAPGVTHYSINRTCTGCTVWTIHTNSNVFGGSVVPIANNLTACQTSCLNTTNCTGIDYNPRNPSGWRCFQLMNASAPITNNVVTGVCHYDVTNNCAGNLLPVSPVSPSVPAQTTPAPVQCTKTWTVYGDSNVVGGREVTTANTLADCQSVCINESTCTGIDYNANNTEGWRCYVLESTNSPINVGIISGVTHYEYNRNCSQGCRDVWTTYIDSNILGGLEVSSANTVYDCMSACLGNSTCTGVDYNSNNSPGQRCFMHFSGTKPMNVGQSRGVNHFHLARNCCSLSWIFYGDSNVFGGWLYPQSPVSLKQCQAACLQNTTCSSIDYDGLRCFLIPSSQTTVINVGQSPGVKHFQLQSNC